MYIKLYLGGQKTGNILARFFLNETAANTEALGKERALAGYFASRCLQIHRCRSAKFLTPRHAGLLNSAKSTAAVWR